MKNIRQGTIHSEVFHPRKEHLASSMGNHGVDVVATPALILFFEAAANNLAAPYYDEGEISVGTHVNIDHLAPALGSAPVTVVAVLEYQQGRRLEFDLVATQGETIVMTGKHYRAVMDSSRFSELPDTEKATKQIDFWFDFHSPWCYFASYRIGEIAREFDATLNWKPVHLANLNQAVDGRRPLEANTRFVTWYKQDQYDTAAMQGLPFDPHHDYPKRPSRALRAAIYAAEHDLAEPFVKTVMQGYWSEQKDISDMDWIKSVGDSIGLNSNELEDAMTGESYKQQLNQNLQQAIDQNLFGLPASVINGKIFWGNDRLDLLRHHLSENTPRL